MLFLCIPPKTGCLQKIKMFLVSGSYIILVTPKKVMECAEKVI